MSLELLDGERVVGRWKSNAVVIPGDCGLSDFGVGDLLPLVGMAGREAIGGHLHVTNMRVAFKAHALNRLRGVLSVPLPSITSCERFRRGVSFGVQVHTAMSSYEFVNWSQGAVLRAVETARRAVGPAELRTLEEFRREVAASLEVRRVAEVANVTVRTVLGLTDGKPTAFHAVSLLNHAMGARDSGGAG